MRRGWPYENEQPYESIRLIATDIQAAVDHCGGIADADAAAAADVQPDGSVVGESGHPVQLLDEKLYSTDRRKRPDGRQLRKHQGKFKFKYLTH